MKNEIYDEIYDDDYEVDPRIREYLESRMRSGERKVFYISNPLGPRSFFQHHWEVNDEDAEATQ